MPQATAKMEITAETDEDNRNAISLKARAEMAAARARAEMEAARKTLEEYLSESSTSPAETAARLVAETHEYMFKLYGNHSPEMGFSKLEGPLECLWIVIIDGAIASSTNHARLIQLLQSIRTQEAPATPARFAFESSWGQRFWQGLPAFGLNWREYTDYRTPDIEEIWRDPLTGAERRPVGRKDKPYERWEYGNHHKFMAECTVHGIVDLAWLGVWMMRHALEEERTAWEEDKAVEGMIGWILIAGESLYAEQKQEDEAVGGEIWLEQRADFQGNRWRFWMEQLKLLAARWDKDATVSSSLKKALEHMETLEVSQAQS